MSCAGFKNILKGVINITKGDETMYSFFLERMEICEEIKKASLDNGAKGFYAAVQKIAKNIESKEPINITSYNR